MNLYQIIGDAQKIGEKLDALQKICNLLDNAGPKHRVLETPGYVGVNLIPVAPGKIRETTISTELWEELLKLADVPVRI